MLFIVTAAINLALYKKYKDAIDYFNQDSQLTVGHFKSIEEKLGSVQSIVQGLSGQAKAIDDRIQSVDNQVKGMDDRIKAAEENLNRVDQIDKAVKDLDSAVNAQKDINKELSSKIDIINSDLLALRADAASSKRKAR
jgi:chromosome segregation ATPase